jgi:hypothetical protein
MERDWEPGIRDWFIRDSNPSLLLGGHFVDVDQVTTRFGEVFVYHFGFPARNCVVMGNYA